jgi:hypothetical protein
VIGNGDYQAQPLPNAVSQAQEIALALDAANIPPGNVTLKTDLRLVDFRLTVDQFVRSVRRGDLVFVYFTGRALRSGPGNYMLPVDFPQGPSGSPAQYSVSANELMRRLEAAGAGLRWIVLDAGAPGLALTQGAPGTVLVTGGGKTGALADALAHLLPAQQSVAKLVEQLRRDVPGVAVSLGSTATGREVFSLRRPNKASPSAPATSVQPEPDPVRAPPISPPPQIILTPPPSEAPIERFPTIEAPDRVSAGAEFSALVSLRLSLATPEVKVEATGANVEKLANGALRMQLACDPQCDIEVVLAAPGFEFADGVNQAAITMKRAEESTPARFVLKSKDGFTGGTRLSATFWGKGNFLARAWRPIEVAAPAPAPVPAPRPSGAPGSMYAIPMYAPASPPAGPGGGIPQPIFKPAPSPKDSSGLPLGVAAPDLTVRWEETGGAHPECTVVVASPHLGPLKVEPCRTAEELRPLFSNRLARIVGGASFRGVTPARADAAQPLEELRGFGMELDQLVPGAFREAFWQLVDKQRTDPSFQFRTIQIYTNNPAFPWELVIPVRSGRPYEAFLGAKFQMARWHIDDDVRDLGTLALPLRAVRAIAPNYSGGAALPSQGTELAAMRSLPGFATAQGTVNGLRSLLEAPPEGIIHFAGHGDAAPGPDGSVNYDIRLEDGLFDPTRLRAFSGLSSHHPLFFLNACDTGQETVAAGLIDGWAGAVLASGASGFVGGLWPLSDRGAAAFSAEFYAELKDGLTRQRGVAISEILMRSREKLLSLGDPTVLAYVFYGDARFRVTAN